MFKSKHTIIALLIAPVLAVIAYFGTDMAISEKPHAAQEGESYKLASKSNCRYTSGLCNMENGEFKVQFRSESQTDSQLNLSLNTEIPLEGIKISLSDDPKEFSSPIDMERVDEQGLAWQVSLPSPQSEESVIRVVISADNTLYYGATGIDFIVYETLFTDESQ